MKTSEMTNQELDRWIAEKRGWNYYPSLGVSWYRWVLRNEAGKMVKGFHSAPPFTTDPSLAMELFKEMIDGGNTLSFSKVYPLMGNPMIGININRGENYMQADAHYRVIAEAYAEFSK